MTGASPNIPSLLRKARIAFSKENYEEAAALYALILQDPEMTELLDIKTRYAFCIEKTGDLMGAIDVYQDIIGIYKEQGEAGAAKATELKVTILQKLASGEPESDKDLEAIDDFAEMSLNSQDIEPLGAASADQAEPEMVARELNTQEIDEVEEVKSAVITQQDLIPVAEEAVPETTTLSEGKQDSVVDHWPAEQSDDGLDHLSMLIRQGIHKNVGKKRSGDLSDNIELSKLHGYTANNLQLEDAEYLERRNEESAQESEKDKKMKEKAAQIFGSKKGKP